MGENRFAHGQTVSTVSSGVSDPVYPGSATKGKASFAATKGKAGALQLQGKGRASSAATVGIDFFKGTRLALRERIGESG